MKKLFDKFFGKKKPEKEIRPLESNTEQHKPTEDMPDQFIFLDTNFQVTPTWIEIFSHFILLEEHNKMPTKDWYATLEVLIQEIGEKEFAETGYKWINACIEKSAQNSRNYKKFGPLAAYEEIGNNLRPKHASAEWVRRVYGKVLSNENFFTVKSQVCLQNFQYYFYHSLGGRIMRGFLHATILLPNTQLLDFLDTFALANPNYSQDAIYVYSQLPKEISVPKLTVLQSRAKNKNILSRIKKAFIAIGKREGLSKAEIQESVIPDYGINSDGQFIANIDDYQAVFAIENLKNSKVFYISKEGKEQKTIPKSLKDNFSTEVKAFKKQCSQIKKSLSAQRRRLESFYYPDREITYKDFIQYYLENNLIRIIAKDLIWNFKNEKESLNLLFREGDFQTHDGKKVNHDVSNHQIKLWHPITSSRDEIFGWRNFMMEQEVIQAFKQAYREVYILTDAERTTESYSNRYASHILNKDHVSALLKARGWSPSGINNSGKTMFKIPDTDLKAEYWVSDVELGQRSMTYGSAHISTDQVRFYKKRTQINLEEVPEIIFSEVMRDVDLFVGVTSIGNDPTWSDRGVDGAMNYWSRYTQGELTESSKVRAEIIKHIVPKMKIRNVSEIDGKYLKIKGKLRTYKIHMGSGNILMEPNDQYLCIVPARATSVTKKLFIPFEGDGMLSIILSKAILLANDDKIEDQTITRQINRQ